MKTTEEILEELSKFMFENGVDITTNGTNLVVSIHKKHGIYDEYTFDENITELKIENKEFVKS